MASNASFEDLEDKLDNFIIRKAQPNQNTLYSDKSGPKVHENVPLTLWHLQQVTPDPDRENVFLICDTNNENPIYFRTCIVYGFVTGIGTHNNFFNKYIIDDSTGSMEACISKKPKIVPLISSLYNEASSLLLTESYKATAERLMRLLKSSRENIDPSPITRGKSLILCGRPNIYRGKMGVDSFSFMIDSGKSRKIEIGFADHLVNWHKNYKSTQSKTKK
ncbi:uncharacterized protein LOC108089597 [Drosophila ficusphila]|uniref:uncharacterized protein LOC108089597 n=1 Tax=Drosophila ficusphila TaxID=30025 RepID=UPI001C8A4BF0|nr:uncharacterized protein LOC108089597 [Drosophila ficusphila]